MKTLLFWGSGADEVARRRHAEGASFLAWSEAGATSLRRAGIPHRTEDLSADAADAVDEAAIVWTKAWGKRPVVDGKSIRQLLAWKGVSLWWFAELYLHYSTRSPAYVRLIERFHRVLEQERPEEVEAFGLDEIEAALLGRTCTARGVLFHGPPGVGTLGPRLLTLRTSLASRWNTLKTLASAVKATFVGPPPRPQAGPSETDATSRRTVLFLSHAAFWRERRDPESDAISEYEHYFDRLIPDVGDDPALRAFVVAVGPRAAFRRRGASDRLAEWLRLHRAEGPYVHVNAYTRWNVFLETRRATRQIRGVWRCLRSSPGVHEAFAHRGVRFGDLAQPDLAATLLLQLPWAVRSYEEMAAALGAVRAAVVCLYAESSGWGRAALAACRAAGVPTVAIQHGILYPKYYSYRHEADEGDCPRPDLTALFGEAAQRILVELGHYPLATLTLTGSPKFDALLEATRTWDREASRARLGIGPGEKLLVVASRYKGIRETHQSIGSAFAGFVRAVESTPGVRCLVKPHPAEPQDAYDADISAAKAARVRAVPPRADLTELLHAADGLVTVESLSAVEALVLSRPVLILNMPTNLREIVDQGAAIGVAEGEDPLPALRALLFDAATAERLTAARERYLSYVACGVDGRATERIIALLRETACGRGVVGL
jgi:hypothetical protein